MYNVKGLGRVAVIAGGPSSERDISIRSGSSVLKALKEEGCDARWLEIGREDVRKELRKEQFDIAFIALHGRFGEDGTIQKMLEDMSIPYTGSGVTASRLALDKIASRRIFQKRDIPVPEYRILDRGSRGSLNAKADSISYPAVVKPRMEGSSIGLSMVGNRGEFAAACEKAFVFDDRIIVERFIRSREITVGILGRRALPVVEIRPRGPFYDFHAKYKDVNTSYIVPAALPGAINRKARRLALMVHDALGCSDFSRVDMLLGENEDIYVLEVNSIPGLTERSLLPKAAQAAGIGFGKLCLRLLRMAKMSKGKKK